MLKYLSTTCVQETQTQSSTHHKVHVHIERLLSLLLMLNQQMKVAMIPRLLGPFIQLITDQSQMLSSKKLLGSVSHRLIDWKHSHTSMQRREGNYHHPPNAHCLVIELNQGLNLITKLVRKPPIVRQQKPMTCQNSWMKHKQSRFRTRSSPYEVNYKLLN